jgi:hypothetical protein
LAGSVILAIQAADELCFEAAFKLVAQLSQLDNTTILRETRCLSSGTAGQLLKGLIFFCNPNKWLFWGVACLPWQKSSLSGAACVGLVYGMQHYQEAWASLSTRSELFRRAMAQTVLRGVCR